MPSPKVSLKKYLATRWRLARTNATSCWWAAIDKRDLEMVHALAKIQPDTRKIDSFVLFRALNWSDPTALDYLLKGGANPNVRHQNNCWDYLLHRAACRGLHEHVRLLLKAGAQLDVRDSSDYTPLGSALYGFGDGAASWGENRKKVVFLLLEAGAEVDQWQRKGRQSALALSPLDLDVLKALLKRSSAFKMANESPEVWFENQAPECSHIALRAAGFESVPQAREFFDVLRDTGAMKTWMPEHHHLLVTKVFLEASMVNSPSSAWLDLLEEQGIQLSSPDLDGKGNTVWHLWATRSDNALSEHWLEALANHPKLLALSNQAGADEKVPWEIVLEKVKNPARLQGLKERFAKVRQASLETHLESSLAPEKPPGRARL